MVMIQISLTERENKTVEIYKALFGFRTKEEAIKDMIKASENLIQEETMEYHKEKNNH